MRRTRSGHDDPPASAARPVREGNTAWFLVLAAALVEVAALSEVAALVEAAAMPALKAARVPARSTLFSAASAPLGGVHPPPSA
ncbi:hypothetical protein Arub01_26450 [Actinomadura rubrobrunea]|uniref:Uncharacterized protein n=1 Tax=Actinomadura rubrobrunea TaxID=115335 RepID=A0A9W6PWR6_9ACTN|nr:hypothetical protein Arub01_26450 [Actinomadura rubrobrunea]